MGSHHSRIGNRRFQRGRRLVVHDAITAAVDYANRWDNTTLGTFTFTQTGPIAVKSHLQSVVVGPRIFFSTKWTDKYKLNPFGEAQFGMSHLSQTVTTAADSVSASDTAFAWLVGGGAEYLLSPHWSARGNLDFMRTQLANEGQSPFKAAGRDYFTRSGAGRERQRRPNRLLTNLCRQWQKAQREFTSHRRRAKEKSTSTASSMATRLPKSSFTRASML